MKYSKKNFFNITKSVFQNNWTPDIDDYAFSILNKCDSLTEKLYIVGAAYYIEQIRGKHNGSLQGLQLQITGCEIQYNQKTYEAIWFVCPWDGWFASAVGGGPSALAFVPQLKFLGHDYHHDFGVFYGESDGGGAPWNFKCAIEIDPKHTHEDRRDKDAYRDSVVDYLVVRINDEIYDEKSWFKEIINIDEKELEQYLAGQ